MKRKDLILVLVLVTSFVLTGIATAIFSSPLGDVRFEEGYLFTFAHISDTQFSGSNAIFKRATSWLAGQDNVSFVVHTGDIVNTPFDETAWRNAHEYMHQLDERCKWGILAGDNDVLSRNRIYLTNYDKYFGNGSFDQHVIVENRLLFILFSWTNSDGAIEEERLNWMDQIIGEHEHLSVVICLHPILFGSFLTSMSSETLVAPNADQIWSHIDKHENIVIVLSGHTHQSWVYIHGNRRKVWCISTEALFEKGYIRLFDVYKDRVEAYAYSPWTNQEYAGPLDRFTIHHGSTSHDVDGDLWGDGVDIMPTHPLVPNGVLFSVALAIFLLVYRIIAR